jgi:hypothetical protein
VGMKRSVYWLVCQQSKSIHSPVQSPNIASLQTTTAREHAWNLSNFQNRGCLSRPDIDVRLMEKRLVHLETNCASKISAKDQANKRTVQVVETATLVSTALIPYVFLKLLKERHALDRNHVETLHSV